MSTNINNPKLFNLNSPAATTNSSTHSTYDSGIHSGASTVYNGGLSSSTSNSHNNYGGGNNGSNNKLDMTQFDMHHLHQHQHQQQLDQLHLHQQHQQQHEHEHDESQYDSNGETTMPNDYSHTNGHPVNIKNGGGSSSHTNSGESICTSEEEEEDDEDGDGSSNGVNDSIPINTSNFNGGNNDSINGGNGTTNAANGGGGDSSFLIKNDQNEKNARKNKVIELYNKGEHCVRKLSEITAVPLTTVYRVIGKLKGINYNIPRGNGAGRKTILDTKDRETLVEILNRNPRISRKALGKELEKLTGKSIHNSTLNRELCRLKHHGTPGNVDTSNIQQLQSPTTTPNVTSSSLNSSLNTPSSTVNTVASSAAAAAAAIMKNNNNNQTPSLHNTTTPRISTKLTVDTNLHSPKIKNEPSSRNHHHPQHQQYHHKEQHQQQQPSQMTNSANVNVATSSSNRMSSSSSTNNLTNPQLQQQQPSLLTPAMLAAAAAALANPHQSSTSSPHPHPLAYFNHPLLAQMQQPFNNLALAAYSQYLSSNGDMSPFAAAAAAAAAALNPNPVINPTAALTVAAKSNTTNDSNHQFQQLDNDYIKLISTEAKRFCDSLSKHDLKPLPTNNNSMRPELAKQIMDLISTNNETPKDGSGKSSREDTIRQLTTTVLATKQRTSGEKMMYDYCLNEAAVQLCILRPSLLTRKEDLAGYAKQILTNLNIYENTSTSSHNHGHGGKRASTSANESFNKRVKLEPTTNDTNNIYQQMYTNLYNGGGQHTMAAVSPRTMQLANVNKQLQDSIKIQQDLTSKITFAFTQIENMTPETKTHALLLQQQLYNEKVKYSELLAQQARLNEDTKHNQYTNIKDETNDENSENSDYEGGGEGEGEGDDNEHDTNSQSAIDENENANAIASIVESENCAQLAGEYNNNNNDDDENVENDDENINVDEVDDDNHSNIMKTDSNNNRSFH